MKAYSLGTIWEFHTRDFTVRLDAIEETEPDLSFDETGETQDKINSGEWLCFCARCRVYFKGHEVGTDYLGNCIYGSLKEFRNHFGLRALSRKEAEARKCPNLVIGSYFSDMVREAIGEARKTIGLFKGARIKV